MRALRLVFHREVCYNRLICPWRYRLCLKSKRTLRYQEALLTVEIEENTVKQAMQKQPAPFPAWSNIPGFRKGKAPYAK